MQASAAAVPSLCRHSLHASKFRNGIAINHGQLHQVNNGTQVPYFASCGVRGSSCYFTDTVAGSRQGREPVCKPAIRSSAAGRQRAVVARQIYARGGLGWSIAPVPDSLKTFLWGWSMPLHASSRKVWPATLKLSLCGATLLLTLSDVRAASAQESLIIVIQASLRLGDTPFTRTSALLFPNRE